MIGFEHRPPSWRILALSAIVAIASLGVWVGLSLTNEGHIQQEAALRARLAALTKAAASMAPMRRELEALRAADQGRRPALTGDALAAAQNRLQAALRALAMQSGARLLSIRAQGDGAAIAAEAQVQSDWPKLARFVVAIEQAAPGLRISALEIQRRAEPKTPYEEPLLSARLVVRADP